ERPIPKDVHNARGHAGPGRPGRFPGRARGTSGATRRGAGAARRAAREAGRGLLAELHRRDAAPGNRRSIGDPAGRSPRAAPPGPDRASFRTRTPIARLVEESMTDHDADPLDGIIAAFRRMPVPAVPDHSDLLSRLGPAGSGSDATRSYRS